MGTHKGIKRDCIGHGGPSSGVTRYLATICVSDNHHICARLVQIKLRDASTFTLAASNDFLLLTTYDHRGDSVNAIASGIEDGNA
jgi:hypothetical protein